MDLRLSGRGPSTLSSRCTLITPSIIASSILGNVGEGAETQLMELSQRSTNFPPYSFSAKRPITSAIRISETLGMSNMDRGTESLSGGSGLGSEVIEFRIVSIVSSITSASSVGREREVRCGNR